MDWEKIKIKSILEILREFEKKSLTIDGEYAVIYSDGQEELKISYKRLENKKMTQIKRAKEIKS